MKKNSQKNTSKSTDLLINFVVDASGSMQNLVRETKDGFNNFVKGEEEAGIGQTYVTLTVFGSTVNTRYVAAHSSTVAELGTRENPYRADMGMTALYDAAGTAISGAEGWLRSNPWFKGKVLTVILTDGGENASREYTLHQLNSMIERKQSDGWVFQFIGSGESAWLQGQSFTAIPQRNRANLVYTGSATTNAYSALNASSSVLRGGGEWNYKAG